MKKSFFYLLLLITIAITSCTKSTTDPRDSFVGNYSGTVKAYKSGILQTTGTINWQISKSTTASDQILVYNPSNGTTVSEIVIGNTFMDSGTTQSSNGGMVTKSVTYTFLGNTLIGNGTMTIIDNTSAAGVYSLTYNLTKM